VPGNTAVTLGVRKPAPRFNRHALIVGVSKYEDPNVPELPGVKFDRESATQMAEFMQVPAENIRYLQDQSATGDAIRKALKELTEQVNDGDRVFVHFSGHGTRYVDQSTGNCVEGLMAYDKGWNGLINNKEMANLLSGITDKTDKLFVMYDACHSGGVAQAANLHRIRSLSTGAEQASLRPKFFSSSEECSRPVNAKTRNLVVEAVSHGTLPEDIIHLSSARENEISFDDADKGGLATQYIRDCMLHDAADLDRSGAITMEKIRQCAQEKINKRMALYSNYLPNNLVLTGNPDFVPVWFSKVPVSPPSRPEAPASSVSVPAETPTAIVEVPAAPPVEQELSGEQALRQMFNQRDAKRKVTVSVGKNVLKIGTDSLEFAVKSDRPGYLYLALAGSDNSSLYLLFPNDLEAKNKVEAGQVIQFPRPDWNIKASGPPGTDNLLVIVADAPRNLSALDGSKVGPFMMSLNNQDGRAKLGTLLSASQASGSPACASSSSVRSDGNCSDAYGATMIKVMEVQ
jgi:hypothetical protein